MNAPRTPAELLLVKVLHEAIEADMDRVEAAVREAIPKGWGVVVLERDGRVTDVQPNPIAPANTIIRIPADGVDAFIERFDA